MTPRLVFPGIALIAALLVGTPPSARADEQRIYVREIPDKATYDAYSRMVAGDRLGKFVIDVRTGEIYYFDVNVYRLHADFVLRYLLRVPWTAESIREYNLNYERKKPQFILGYVAHHTKVDRWSFAFWEGDEIGAADLLRTRRILSKTFFVRELAFRPDSPEQDALAKRLAKRGLPTVDNDELYKSSPYQAFNPGRATGTLRVVPLGTAYEDMLFEPTDIVLLRESYPDISPVAGILATKPSTPLAHVNLRARAWGIPNASFVRAYDDYAALDGKVVIYEVREQDHALRPANEQEIAAWRREQREARTVKLPAADLDRAAMPMLDHLGRDDVRAYGAKTANLGAIASARLPEARVPAGFGLPFFYYRRHMSAHGLDERLGSMLADARWSDAAWRKAALAEFRAAIRAAPIDPEVLGAIYKRVRLRLGGAGVFVRSSTNAEDLPGFSGAGLYDTVPNVRGKRALGEAVKQVWASLWNQRAVEERALFGIDHREVHAGVLIQVGVDASAAGVLVTTNLYDREDEATFTINAKRGLGMRVVEGQRVPEQVLYDTDNGLTKIISRSDDPVMLVFDPKGGIREVPNDNDGVILTKPRARQLATAVQAFLPVFPAGQAQDVEWLLDGETVWIVQSRPFVQR